MANVFQSNDFGVSATRPFGYIPASGFKTTIPVRENTASILRKEKIEHRSGHLGTLRTDYPVSITRSTFSPVVKKPSNEQIFQERLNLIGHWFDLWSISQRKRFLKEIFHHCGKPELDFVQVFSDSTLAVKRQDFTKVLPAFLCKYIFSYLDPKSLSRASQVSHHWRNLSEHDEVWMSKCIKHGWYLQYQPSKLENGSWKRHYITAIESLASGREKYLDNEVLAGDLFTDRSDLFTSFETFSRMETPRTHRSRSKSPLTSRSNRSISLEDRPKWQDPDRKPTDTSWDNFTSMSSEGHPNNPKSPSSAYIHSKRWGVSSFLTEKTYGLGSMDRNSEHPLKTEEFAQYHPNEKAGTLSELLQAQRVSEGSQLLKETPWHLPEKKTYENRFVDSPKKQIAGENVNNPVYPNHSHPRVIFISSRLPAKELLQECVMFGVISVVYEYEGTTIDTLVTLLSNVLKNRQAHSIGFLTDGGIGELWLTKDSPITLETIKKPEIQDFWLKLAMHLIPPGSGGHIDIFTPLASSDAGLELLFQLNVLMGLKCTSPINMIGGFRCFMGDWLEKPEKMKPVNHYFREERLIIWIATAHRIAEALYETEKFLGRYFSTQRRILISEVIGKIVFDALLLENLKSTVCDVIPVIIDGLLEFRNAMEKESPLQFLSQYLCKRDLSSSSELTELQTYHQQKNGEAICDLLCLTKYEKDRAYKLLSINHNIEHEPDRRTAAAVELLSSELEYMRTLSILVDVFMNPFQRTLDASKVIIGIGSIHALFSDICSILEVSKGLLKDLTHKMDNWNNESTLADSMIKLCGKSKAYTNYINNYPIVMRTYDMLIETNPAFRAFISDNEETARTKMLTFHELYMIPTKRVSEYILILHALHANTPPEHSDKTDLTVALKKLNSLNEFVSNHKNKLIKDKEITQIEGRIINCPSLLEGNRQFLREDYVRLLKKQAGDPVSYIHIQDLILFLFSDNLLICILKTQHPPFERVLKKKIIFSTCLALSKIKVDVITDSAFIQNGIQLSTKKAQWILKFMSFQDRVSFVHTIEAAIRSLVRAD